MEETWRKVFILGAGRSSSHLIQHLLENAENWKIHVHVGDGVKAIAEEKVQGHLNGTAFDFDAQDIDAMDRMVAQSDLVISMLPAFMHPQVARLCLKHYKHLITPSYVSAEMKAMHDEAVSKGLIFMNELGVDPGIDHMSAMQIIDGLKEKGARIKGFYSLCGGLIAPKSDNNPWHYKVTWNPRNIVLAGAGGLAHYRESGKEKLIPYNRLYSELMQVDIPGYGKFDGYANRDSMAYETLYNLEGIETLYRGTLRRPGFSQAWRHLVNWGMTDDQKQMDWSGMSMADFTQTFLPTDSKKWIQETVTKEELFKLQWLGLWDITSVPIAQGTPAQVIQKLIEERWELAPSDADMLVMCHLFDYELDGKQYRLQSHMVMEGEDNGKTAMSATVGLPMAMSVPYILNDIWKDRGVLIPVAPHFYGPLLAELKTKGIQFHEQLTER
ncbi:MAG: saccharopine dehydrogenase [Bacteroidetes bacterium]|nr:saccharopine dehydrogenase [Bacteroidota bacterium]